MTREARLLELGWEMLSLQHVNEHPGRYSMETCPHPDCVLVVREASAPQELTDNALAIACAELTGYRDGFEGFPQSESFATSDENLAYVLWFNKARKIRSELVSQIDTLSDLLKRKASAPPAAELTLPQALANAIHGQLSSIFSDDDADSEEKLTRVEAWIDFDLLELLKRDLARGESAPSLTSTPVLDAFDAEGEARELLREVWPKTKLYPRLLDAVTAKLRRAFFLGQQNPEASAPPAAYTILVEREEEDGRSEYFASWTTGDGKEGGCAQYSVTVVGALANLCATLIKVDEDKAHERRGESAPSLPPSHADAMTLLKEAVVGLSQGACLTCGAEPGVNIDCKGCQWIARAQGLIAAAPSLPPPQPSENPPNLFDQIGVLTLVGDNTPSTALAALRQIRKLLTDSPCPTTPPAAVPSLPPEGQK